MILPKYQLDWKKLILSAVSAFLVATAFGQTVVSEQTDTGADTPILVSVSPLEQAKTALSLTFQQEQQTLNQAEDSLIAQGATDEQITAWEQQNAVAFQTQMARAKLLAAYDAFQPMEMVSDVIIPDGASQVMEDFLVERATLSNALAQIHNQLFQGSISSITSQWADALYEQEAQLFQQQNAVTLQTQATRAKILADQSAHEPWEVPPLLQVSSNANPQLTSFLNLKNQIARGEAQVHNQYCTGDLTQLEAAMELWRQQHATWYAQLVQQAQVLAQLNSVQENNHEIP